MSSDSLKETEEIYKTRQKSYGKEGAQDTGGSNKSAVFTVAEEKDAETETETASTKSPAARKEKYPKIVFLIILNEFCERFSYYGLRTVLFIYLTTFVRLSSDTATALYHGFTVVCYFSPLMGAIIADGYIGLYRTILYVSCLYCVGEVVLTLTSMPPLGAPNVAGPIIGLIIIAIGTGGIKPCVSAFGGNQFSPTQKRYLATFFSIFYLSINIGSTISTVITPIFRSEVKCFGNDCYALAFGVPAGAMFLSIIFFVAGTSLYKRDDEKAKNGKNIITQTVKCVGAALVAKAKRPKHEPKKESWLDYAEAKFEPQLISDVKALFKVLFVFLPLPIFWALYDQQGSRWTEQAQQLNGRVSSSFTVKPDQMQAVNPIIIVFMVPVFDFVIYPMFAKIGLFKRQLQRMCFGLVLAIASFIIAAILESRMQTAFAARNPTHQIRLFNVSPCHLQLQFNATLINVDDQASLNEDQLRMLFPSGVVNVNAFCANQTLTSTLTFSNSSLPKNVLFYTDNRQIRALEYAYSNKNYVIGSSLVKFDLFQVKSFDMLDVSISNNIGNYRSQLNVKTLLQNTIFYSNSSYQQIDYADYDLTVKDVNGRVLIQDKLIFETCAVYSILFYPNPNNSSALEYKLVVDVYSNGVSLAWQLIQIFVMTIGEIMFSISGLSFAYSQAPPTMKSVLQAMWCMTVAFGNLIVVIVAEGRFVPNQVDEYFLFAGLLGFATIAFCILSYFYKYRDSAATASDAKSDDVDDVEETEEKSSNQSSKKEKDNNNDGVANVAYSKSSIDADIKLIKMTSLDPN